MGVWWSGSWRAPERDSFDVAAELEALGYTAVWSSGRFDPGLSPHFERLLAATTHAAVASGIVSIWSATPADLAVAVADLDTRYPGRFLLGLGASHAPLAEGYARPYAHMVGYLDALDSAPPAVAADRRVLAALGPRMLALARERAAGAHPYFVPVEHTVRARQVLGPGPLLAPEVTVVLESDPGEARQLARTFMAGYLTLPNYTNNLRALGYTGRRPHRRGKRPPGRCRRVLGEPRRHRCSCAPALRGRGRPRLRPGRHRVTRFLSSRRVPRACACAAGQMTPTSAPRTQWRGPIGSGELRALFEDAWGQAFDEDDVVRRLQAHSLGWVTGRDDEGRLVGFVNVAWDGALHAFLLDTSVASGARRARLGTRLVDAAVEGARGAGCRWLHVDFEPELRSFYLGACGFVFSEAGVLDLRAAR